MALWQMQMMKPVAKAWLGAQGKIHGEAMIFIIPFLRVFRMWFQKER